MSALPIKATPLKLNQHERHQPLWVRVAEEVERLRAIERAKLEKDMTETETAKLRGKIAAYTAVLGFATDTRAEMSNEP